MDSIVKKLRAHKFETHLAAIFFMAVPPVLLYFVAERGALGWIWILLSLVILGNILALLVD